MTWLAVDNMISASSQRQEGLGWQVNTPSPELLAQGVHIWRVDLDLPAYSVRHGAGLLDDAEVDRAGRFYFEQDRRRYVARHVALRLLLARLAGVEPVEVAYRYGPHGKPSMCGHAMAGDIRFNTSHSGNLALIAAARVCEVGVDVERLRVMPDALSLATRFFSADEVADLRTALGTDSERLAFFNCWTRKEAIIKTLGRGLTYPLDSFSVTVLSGQPAAIRRDGSTTGVLTGWSLVALHPAPGFVGALAVAGHHEPVTTWSFDWNG